MVILCDDLKLFVMEQLHFFFIRSTSFICFSYYYYYHFLAGGIGSLELHTALLQ